MLAWPSLCHLLTSHRIISALGFPFVINSLALVKPQRCFLLLFSFSPGMSLDLVCASWPYLDELRPPRICSECTSLRLPVVHVTFKPNLNWDVPVVKLVSFWSPSSFFFTGLLMTVELEFLYLSFSSLIFSRLNLMDCFTSQSKTYTSFHSHSIILFSSSWNIYRCTVSFLFSGFWK